MFSISLFLIIIKCYICFPFYTKNFTYFCVFSPYSNFICVLDFLVVVVNLCAQFPKPTVLDYPKDGYNVKGKLVSFFNSQFSCSLFRAYNKEKLL